MGIRTFTFNGESSDTYGVMITQNESYNAPARAGEMVSIPGRNGAYWHDLGRFENIEVTYKCAIGEGTKADFVDAMSDIRAWLCSPVGYCRLEDDYNPNEYRMAVYKSGLETDKPLVTGAEFEITFDCKPQRFLKSGETAVSVTSGDTITNPTLFDAKPQLQVKGYGEIDIGVEAITVDNVPIGTIQIASAKYAKNVSSTNQGISVSNMETGDDFTVSNANVLINYFTKGTNYRINAFDVNSSSNCNVTTNRSISHCDVTITADNVTFAKGTSSSLTATTTLTMRVTYAPTSTTTDTNITVSFSISYNGTNRLAYSLTMSANPTGIGTEQKRINAPTVFGNSTKSALGNPMYIDLDIGECYNLDSGTPVSVNDAVSMPAELPVLPSGATTITYDNTVTQFKIVPRWWKV